MANKVIAIVDINNDQNQYIETLLIANILEKKCNKLCVMDLNPYHKDNVLLDTKQVKQKDGIYTLKLFDRSNYIFPTLDALMALKMNDMAKSVIDKNDIVLINPSQVKFDYNTKFYDLSNELIVFADIKQDISNNLLNFFITHKLNKKHAHVYVYNYEDNMQDEKTYLSLIKRFQSNNIKIDKVACIAKYSTIDKIINIDPWEDIYKKINGAF